MKSLYILFLFLCSFTVLAQKKQFDELTWPRDMTLNESDVTLYQPQFESFENNVIEGRMAVSVKSKSSKLTFGAFRFMATVRTDLDTREQINRESMSRQQGAQRYNQYNSTRNPSPGSRSAGSRAAGAGTRRR